MATGNRKGGGNHGNKGSGYYFEMTNLQLLDQMRVTLAAILSSNSAGKDFETTMVKDSLGVFFLEARFFDSDTGTFGATEYYIPGSTTTAVPTGAVTYVSAGDATETTLEAARVLIERGVWDLIAGNSIAYVFYTPSTPGTDPDNLDGKKNILTAAYSDGGGVVVTQTFTWDVDGDIVSITAS